MVLADRVSRGKRVQEIQKACGYEDDNIGFAKVLNEAATKLGLDPVWHATRLSKVRKGTQDLSIADGTTLSYVDPEKRGWTWIAFGLDSSGSADPWEVLAQSARKKARRGTA